MSLRSYVLLCRDGIPEALADLYGAADVGTIHEAAWVVIHFLMLETGYICASEVQQTETENNVYLLKCSLRVGVGVFLQRENPEFAILAAILDRVS